MHYRVSKKVGGKIIDEGECAYVQSAEDGSLWVGKRVPGDEKLIALKYYAAKVSIEVRDSQLFARDAEVIVEPGPAPEAA